MAGQRALEQETPADLQVAIIGLPVGTPMPGRAPDGREHRTCPFGKCDDFPGLDNRLPESGHFGSQRIEFGAKLVVRAIGNGRLRW